MIKRKDGLWQDSVLSAPGSGKRVYFYGRTQAEVKKKMLEYAAEKDHGPLFADVADAWDTWHREAVSYNGHVMYRAPYRMALDAFGYRRIHTITAPEIHRYIQQIAARGYAQRTVKAHLTLLHMIFQFAILQGHLLQNPADHIPVPKGLKVTRRGLPQGDEIQKVKDGLAAPFGLFAYLLLYTGLRRGEALALRFEDVDRQAGFIHVSRSLYFDTNTPVVKETKTAAGTRSVPLLEPLAKALPAARHGLVFASPDGGLLTQTMFRRRWAAYTKATGVTATPHQFRHLYVTLLAEAGLDEWVTKEIVGHSNITTTRNIYTHLRQEKLGQASDVIRQAFQSLD